MTATPRSIVRAAVLAAVGVLVASSTPATADNGGSEQVKDLAGARRATATYHRLDVALTDGFGLTPADAPAGAPLHECISNDQGPGAMGLHYINGAFASDAVLDVTKPAALVYEPTKNGRTRLVGAEYVVFASAWEAAHPGEWPTLFGRDLTYVPDGNRYELPAFYQVHAWLWKRNPHGMFADHNPRVSCQHAQ